MRNVLGWIATISALAGLVSLVSIALYDVYLGTVVDTPPQQCIKFYVVHPEDRSAVYYRGSIELCGHDFQWSSGEAPEVLR